MIAEGPSITFSSGRVDIYPSMTISQSAGTRRSLVTHFTSSTWAAHAGSFPPGIRPILSAGMGASPHTYRPDHCPDRPSRASAFRVSVSPVMTLACLVQVPVHSGRLAAKNYIRYMPIAHSVSGSSVCTNGSVTKRPPSCGQHFSTGNRSNRAASPYANDLLAPRWPLTSRGSQRDMRPSNGIRNLSNRSGLGEVSAAKSSSIRPVSGSRFTPSANAIRRSEPIILVSTGNGVPVF